ncbi:hypothetical protein [Bartonella sp. LJL80]
MTLPYRIGFLALLFAAAFISGFFYGRSYQHKATLQSVVEAFQTREEIDHETSDLSPIDACIAIGGLPNECAALLRRVESSTESE